MAKKVKVPLECVRCGSGWVNTLQDGTRVCRKCGHREKPKRK